MSAIFKTDIGDDGIATITWDLPGASMNVLTEEGIRDLDAAVDRVLADTGIRAVILTSAKPDFAGGMDLRVLSALKDRAQADPQPAATLFGFVMALHGVLRKIERAGADPRTGKGGKPFVWAAPGTAMGIGLELGLACHHRIAADRADAKIGLPEIKVGLFPGAGGTTRLVRMLGLMGAAPFLLEGKTPDPKRAKAAGLIDAVAAPEALLDDARAWALAATEADAVKPWDRKGYRLPGGAPYTPDGFQMFLGASAMTHGRSKGVYPAANAMLSAVYEGALVPFDTALRIEARHFTAVLMDPTAGAMIRTLFVSKQALDKGAVRPAGQEPGKVRRLGVLGAGMMGAGIAQVAAQAGIAVTLLDRDTDAAQKGLATIAERLNAAVSKRRLTEDGRDATLARITPTSDYATLSDVDMVIEAVFEDPDIKAEVTAAAEAQMPETAIFATNTSTLPISDLARASQRPERFIGIHFFSPVDRMQLVEIIRGRETGDAAVSRALDLVRQIRKTPIVVNDARFFYANRCIIPYINEGLTLLAEGVAPALVENAALSMGMPVGPLQLVDETSLDLGHRIAQATARALGPAYTPTAADRLLAEMVSRGRLGRKAGAGLYDYDARGKRTGLWPGLAELCPTAPRQPDVEGVRTRLRLVQTLEAVRALEEGVLTDIREGDVAAILGWGYMPWSGGPFSWLDRIGARTAVVLCDRLEAEHGARFAAPALLRGMADRGETFYPEPSRAVAA